MGVELFAGATVIIAIVFGYAARRYFDFKLEQLKYGSEDFKKLNDKIDKLEDKLTGYMMSRNG